MDDFETRLATLLQDAAIAVDDRLDDVRAVPVRPRPPPAVLVAGRRCSGGIAAGTVGCCPHDDRHSIRPAVPSVSTAATDWTELPAPLDPGVSAGSVATDRVG
jgi:hypothetical protein